MEKKKKMTSFGVLKKYRAKVIIAPILKGVEVVCELVVPFIVSSIIDQGLNENGTHFHDKNFILY